MRAPYQILAIPYRIVGGTPLYCVLHRSDLNLWQFVAGGGEEHETPLESAKREAWEETGAQSDCWIPLKSLSYLPVTIVSEACRRHWSADTYVIPEYAFGFLCSEEIRLSQEHTEYSWLNCTEAAEQLHWDSNRTALYELNCRLRDSN